MKIEEIEDFWSEDSKIDRTNLDGESLKIPELHNKYYKIYIREKVLLSKKQTELDVLLKDKWELYTGKLDKQTLQERGWEQFDYVVLKGDIEKYLDADSELIEKKLEVSINREKVQYLQDIISVINNRSFHIKNAIEYLKWTQGA